MKQHICSMFVFSAVSMLVMPGGGNLLENGGFETGDLGGWIDDSAGSDTLISGSPADGAQDGDLAALLNLANGVATAVQSFPANPGDEFNLSGWLLTESELPTPITGNFGLLKIEFRDSGGNILAPASVSVGQEAIEFPGIDSRPVLDQTRPVNEWLFTEAQGVAPAGTVEVQFLALNIDFEMPTGKPNAIWVDNMSATLVTGGGNLLENGSFESGLTGWLPGSATVGAPGAGAESGSFAVKAELGPGVGGVRQSFPAMPGEEYNMQGFMLNENPIPAGPSFGLLKIVFRDANGVDLSVSEISQGTQDNANPGVESLPRLDSNTPTTDEWVFTEAQGVAPPNTVEVVFLALNVDFAGGVNPIWFDSIEATLVTDKKCLLGDADMNGSVELADIPAFVNLLAAGSSQCEGDINGDGTVALDDIPGFVDILSGN